MRGVVIAGWLVQGTLLACMPYRPSQSLAPPSDLPGRYALVPYEGQAAPAGGQRSAEAEAEGHVGVSTPIEEGAGMAVSPPSGGAPEPTGAAWWQAFDDAALAELIERALAQNLNLQLAGARVEQARALVDQASAPRWPRVGAQAQATWTRSVNALVGAAADNTLLRASLPVSYEVDWFARYATQSKAAQLDAEAARADAEATAMTLAAQVAEAWFDVLDARARRDLLDAQLQINQTFLELVSLRFEQGLAAALDVHQQRQQIAATRAQIELTLARERVMLQQLSVLLGETARGQRYAPDRRTLPAPPPSADPGVPADLIEQRPDVRAAARRIEAADKRLAASLSARLPTLLISGGPGYTWTRFDAPGPFGGTTHGPEYTAGATLELPLFDGFLRNAQIDLDRARGREAALNYTRAIQQAVLEVESALVQEHHQRRHIVELTQQLRAAQDALESGRDRYRQGLSDFLPVLTALQGVQQTELLLFNARRQLLSYRVQLHRALGGKWTQDIGADRPAEASP